MGLIFKYFFSIIFGGNVGKKVIRAYLPTVGVAELSSFKRLQFFELSENGGHMLFFPNTHFKEMVESIFTHMKETDENPTFVFSAPSPYLPAVVKANLETVNIFTRFYFAKEPFFVEEVNAKKTTQVFFYDGSGKTVEHSTIIQALLNSSTYFGSIVKGNPSLPFSAEELTSGGSILYFLVNTVLAPKADESFLFKDEEGFCDVRNAHDMTADDVIDFIQTYGTPFRDVKLLVAKIFTDVHLHAGGFLVRFLTSQTPLRKIKDLLREARKLKARLAFYRFMPPLLVSIGEKQFVSHVRYTQFITDKKGNRSYFLIFKMVELPQSLDELPFNSPKDLKQIFNTGRRGPVMFVQVVNNEMRDVIMFDAETGRFEKVDVPVFVSECGGEPLPLSNVYTAIHSLSFEAIHVIKDRLSTDLQPHGFYLDIQ